MSAEPVEVLLGYADLAVYLGVSTNQVWTWAQRREANGFPEPAAQARWGGRKRPLYDLAEVVAWHRSYVPSRAPLHRRRREHGWTVLLPDGQVGPLPVGWMTLAECAVEMGLRPKASWNWAYRRATNGFPMPKGTVKTMSQERRDVYDIDEVRQWRAMYRPQSGRPRATGR